MPGSNIKKILGGSIIGLVVLMIFGLVWAFVGESGTATSGLVSGSLGWYLFSYAMGLTMIVLPCTLPLAFVIVPMVLKKGAAKGFGLAIAFGLGVSITLSLYGLAAAIVGKAAIGGLGAPLETVKNWVYFIAGIFAYLFALGEIGLVKFRMPSYTGAAPAFIQKQGDYFKALLLGLFLGNIGVGCPHPATPLILTEIASSGDLFYGWSLFLVHAIGRVIPLLILAFLALLGVNALQWLVSKKDKLERATGWAMVFVAGFILTLGLFTHDWWVNSGQHTFLELLTQEKALTSAIAGKLEVANMHTHGLEEGTGLFGLPLTWGNWFMVLLWVVPLFWYYRKLKKQEGIDPKLLKQRFWTYITLTALLVVSFVYYLPTRFLLQNQLGHHDGMAESSTTAEMMDHHSGDQSMPMGANHRDLLVSLEAPAQTSLIAGATTTLKFSLTDKSTGGPLTVSELELGHEKLMHVIGARSDLKEFFHIHPAPSADQVSLVGQHIFPTEGIYKIWSEVKHAGEVHVFDHANLIVGDENQTLSLEITFDRRVIIGNYLVSLVNGENFIAGVDQPFGFKIETVSGQPVLLDNYLGALMHLSIMREDLGQLIHAHPHDGGAAPDDGHDHEHGFMIIPPVFADTSSGHSHGEEVSPTPSLAKPQALDGSVNFSALIDTPGRYKMFAQFRPTGAGLSPDETLLATFWIEVKPVGSVSQAPAKIESRILAGTGSGVWWLRLVVSLVMIIILSFIIKRLLRVQL
ncbi:MAG: cytochrome c biogenesis protein CcdA [Patescibacteria group bacterium]